jgi:hypothetical protein
METPLPFFYYDILSRIVPGAATLSVLWQVQGFGPVDWFKSFVQTGEKDSWEKLVVPILLVGLSYVVGVLFEVFDYVLDVDLPEKWNRMLPRLVLNPMMEVSTYLDDRAFFWALRKRGRKNHKGSEHGRSPNQDGREGAAPAPSKWGATDWKDRQTIKDRRSDLWERLTYLGSSDEKMKSVFAHCHRFQSEQKMFLHLIYPAALFVLLWICQFRYSPYSFPIHDLVAALIAIPVLALCCRSRCRRRWLQVVTFSVLIEDEERKAGAADSKLSSS